ncbi:uncharacterized protein EI90DRAFT_3041698 [Cantharellus anzutake]|uniref:uncharacterized protein n=1 Tax=Cantharellus anzutake TaxID=1750568 RepID=UPI001904B6A2|nr:uncharacterized protein EI90DRAFT_3041698 [Cantharellus anzutake]KAF8338116.1 hypothetical protein EI90DRAFT_3041698 [Cantharellus anzutake]
MSARRRNLRSHDDSDSETEGLTQTELRFSSRHIPNTTVSLLQRASSSPGRGYLPLYVIESVKTHASLDAPSSIHKFILDDEGSEVDAKPVEGGSGEEGKGGDDRKFRREHVATIEWRVFSKDLITMGNGEKKMLKDVLPMTGILRRYTMHRSKGDWQWSVLGDRPRLLNASGQVIARWSRSKKFKIEPTEDEEGAASDQQQQQQHWLQNRAPNTSTQAPAQTGGGRLILAPEAMEELDMIIIGVVCCDQKIRRQKR